jgi:hypothetical protein
MAFGEAWAKLGDRLVGAGEKLVTWLTRDRRRLLPQREVVIGTYEEEGIAADLRAKIVLGEAVPPDPDIFFDRIRLGRPFCGRCSRPLDKIVHFMAGQVGYECRGCGVEASKDYVDLKNDALGAVRRDYLSFWSRYQDEIRHLTGGKPRRWKVPD